MGWLSLGGAQPAAADEVSALTAAQFAAHAQLYQAVSAQAAAIHEAFVNTLGTSAGSYAATEAAIRGAIDRIAADGLVAEDPQVIRIERE